MRRFIPCITTCDDDGRAEKRKEEREKAMAMEEIYDRSLSCGWI